MTVLNRKKICLKCNQYFNEKKSDSNKQWMNRLYCSIKCNNSSNERKKSIFERLEKFQIKKDGCWLWSGNTDGKGYGTLSNRNGAKFSPEKAHRVSYEKKYGNIPKGLNVCHKCDNPECTNPDHLFLGTQKQNMMDCSMKGRLNKKSLNNLAHERKLTEIQVEEISKINFIKPFGPRVGRSKNSVAAEYGVSVDLIKMIAKGTYYDKR